MYRTRQPVPLSRDDFTIAIICALQAEVNAVHALLDDVYAAGLYRRSPRDENQYVLGRIGAHYVVVTVVGVGSLPAAKAAAGLEASFQNIELALVVGICGGVPDLNNTIRGPRSIFLGDVIVSTDIVSWPSGTLFPHGIVSRESVGKRPSRRISNLLTHLATDLAGDRLRSLMEQKLETILRQERFKEAGYPGSAEDKLYNIDYRHKHRSPDADDPCALVTSDNNVAACESSWRASCSEVGCSDNHISRQRSTAEPNTSRIGPVPNIFFGRIATSDMVIRSGNHREEGARNHNIIAFEMEGLGIWEYFNTIIVKGVADYADSHKNKLWQPYAQAVAAACAGAILNDWVSADRALAPPSESYLSASHPSAPFREPPRPRSALPENAGDDAARLQSLNTSVQSKPRARSVSPSMAPFLPPDMLASIPKKSLTGELRCACGKPILYDQQRFWHTWSGRLHCAQCRPDSRVAGDSYDIKLSRDIGKHGCCKFCYRQSNNFRGLIAEPSGIIFGAISFRICVKCLGEGNKLDTKTEWLMKHVLSLTFIGNTMEELKSAFRFNLQ